MNMSGHDHHMMGPTTEHMHHGMHNTTGGMHHHPTTMNHGNHGGHGGAAGGDHGGMKMYFHFDQSATILFEFWKTSSAGGMVGSCIGIFFLAVLYEGLKVFREHLLRSSNVMVRYNTMPVSSSQDTMVTETHKTVGGGSVAIQASNLQPNSPSARARMCSAAHVIQSLLHVLQIIISYFLMLIFMTYNVWLCIAVALGAGAGYFIFAWKRAIVVDVNEHCH